MKKAHPAHGVTFYLRTDDLFTTPAATPVLKKKSRLDVGMQVFDGGDRAIVDKVFADGTALITYDFFDGENLTAPTRARVPIEELVSRPASPVQKKPSCGGYFYSGEELVSRTTRAAKP